MPAEASPDSGTDESTARAQFMAKLSLFMLQNGKKDFLARIPTIAHHALDLFRLYEEVCARGGVESVIQRKLWSQVTQSLGLPPKRTDAATRLREHYVKYLYAFEQKDKFGLTVPLHVVPRSVAKRSSLLHSDRPAKKLKSRSASAADVSDQEGDTSGNESDGASEDGDSDQLSEASDDATPGRQLSVEPVSPHFKGGSVLPSPPPLGGANSMLYLSPDLMAAVERVDEIPAIELAAAAAPIRHRDHTASRHVSLHVPLSLPIFKPRRSSIDFCKLPEDALRRYLSSYLSISPRPCPSTKDELAVAVQRHFASQRAREDEIIHTFLDHL
eukprot:TRINITY_DN4662_c0_g4_i1.p1 TRINITY_DN4662_c0_g4~~TRINITY_DN4662_c0_g4_i1.p1  ORF type:complete len:374 (+),score=68.69 TRINITY_DN4662_c0_g4_i1:136-1122(+)